jgi:carboxymethylenebutenolidase
MRGSDASISLGDEQMPIYVTLPEGEPPWPALLVIHEAFGLNDDIRRISDRFAVNGYLAAAPDLICGGRLTCLFHAFQDLNRGGGPTVERARAALRWLADRPDVSADRVGVAGFCMGGGFALLLGAGDVIRVRAVADNYGAVPEDEVLRRVCPVVASYGERDRAFRDQARRLQRTLSETDIPHDVKIYPDAGHSFVNQGDSLLHKISALLMSVGYVEAAAEDTWDRMLAFFAEYV